MATQRVPIDDRREVLITETDDPEWLAMHLFRDGREIASTLERSMTLRQAGQMSAWDEANLFAARAER